MAFKPVLQQKRLELHGTTSDVSGRTAIATAFAKRTSLRRLTDGHDAAGASRLLPMDGQASELALVPRLGSIYGHSERPGNTNP
jgi:hypothetical protein